MDYRNLKNLEETANECKIKSEIIKDWVDSKLCPHYFLCGGGPLFSIREMREWITLTQIKHFEGKPIPKIISVIVNSATKENWTNIPKELQNINELCVFRPEAMCSGIYFLCHESEIIYIGQSKIIFKRVAAHLDNFEGEIDAVFYLPTPISQLDRLEAEFINIIKPKMNKVLNKTKLSNQKKE